MAKEFDVLKEQANVIKNEVEDGANTASRVGGMFEDIVDRIEEFQKLGYIFAGVATPTTNPGTPDGNVFYIAKNPGVYPNFSSIEVYFSEIGILYWNTSSWKKHSISLSKLIEEVNVSNIYPTDGTDGSNKYTLETAIAKVGEELRHAGLKVTFLNAEGKTETWEFQGGAFTSAESWRKRDAVEVVQGLGDGENAVVSQKAVTDVTGLGTYTKFSTASTYRVGFIVEKDGVLYEFIADHVPGGWNEGEVKLFTLDSKSSKALYHSVFKNQNVNTIKVDRAIKEFWLSPNIEISDRNNIVLGNVSKEATSELDTDLWRIILYDGSKETVTAIESFLSAKKENSLEIIKGNRGSYVLIDWRELPVGAIVSSVDPIYKVDADYVSDIDNFPILKEYIKTGDYDIVSAFAKKVYYHSLTVNDTENTKILNKIVKELWLSSKITTTNVGLGNIRCNYTGGTAVNYWGVFLYDTDNAENLKLVEVFASVNKKHALELIKGTNGSYILIDWREAENGRQYFASTSSEYNLNNDYVRDINNFPVIKQYLDLQNFKPQVNITELFDEHFNTPAISWVDDDFSLTSVPKIKGLCDEVGCKCDFGLVPQSTGGTNLDYGAVYSISEEALALAKSYELEGFHIEMHPPHYGWYASSSNDGDYSGRKWVENSLVKTMRVFKENGLLNSSCIIYPGSSGGNSEVINMASCHVEFGVNAGAGNGMNDGVHNKFSLNRLFISLTSSHTKTWYKGIIDEAVSKGVWLILGTHGHKFTDSETVDETTNSLANLKEIIQYANEKCSIAPISQIFRIRRPVLDLYK